MNANSIFQFLIPKDKKFFPLFEEASSNLILIATELHEAVNLPLSQRDEIFQKMTDLETKIEDITRRTNLELSRNFITPFDREDIYLLITSIDTVAGNLNGAASRMKLFPIDNITKSNKK